MTDYDNTNRFVLFKNEKKRDDKDPDRTGTLNVDGVEYFIDGWSWCYIRYKDTKLCSCKFTRRTSRRYFDSLRAIKYDTSPLYNSYSTCHRSR